MTLWRRFKDNRNLESDLDREIRAHLDLEAEDAAGPGVSLEEARRAAQRSFGNPMKISEEVREAWGWARLQQFTRDVAYGLRQVRRNPAFSAIAIATLALGIGVNTAMFSAVDAVLIKPLPYLDASRLVMLWDDMSYIGFPKAHSTPAEWSEWRGKNDVFTDLAASEPGDFILSGDGNPEQIPGRRVTANLWSVLGVKTVLGRTFTPDEDAHGARVAVISYGLWQRRFAGANDVLGRKLIVSDNPYEVIGVMPRDFYFMPARDIDIWVPVSFTPADLTKYAWNDVEIVGRLRPGVTLAQARQSMDALSRRVSAPHAERPRSAVVTPLREQLAGETQTALILLLCASAAILLIACVNLANLLLSRGAVRRREVTVRAALGAGRGRLVAQFLAESLVLAGIGAIAGLILATPVMRFLETMVPETMSVGHFSLDWRVLAFSAAIAITAGLAFGLAPALGGSRVPIQQGLHDGGRGSAGARSHWLQHSLIVVETALAVVLLTGGILLLQTFRQLRQTDLGIGGEKVLTFVTPLFRYSDFDKRVAFVNAQLKAISAIPGVISAGAITRIPLTETALTTRYMLSGQTSAQSRGQDALSRVVTRGYFPTIGARLREGRFFDESDRLSDAPSAVVNESFANRNFPGRSAIGERFQFERRGPKAYWYTVVGVVKEIRERGVAEGLKPAIYRLHDQGNRTDYRPEGIVVRTSVKPESIVPSVRKAIWSVDGAQAITAVRTIENIVDEQLATPSQNTTLLTAFALLALLLASIGLYGVLSSAVTQRTSEIGVRMALGATSASILMSFGRRGLALTLAGLAVGLLLSTALARLMTSLLYGFTPDYLPAALGVSAILLAVAIVACLIPARRASRVDPTLALQHE